MTFPLNLRVTFMISLQILRDLSKKIFSSFSNIQMTSKRLTKTLWISSSSCRSSSAVFIREIFHQRFYHHRWSSKPLKIFSFSFINEMKPFRDLLHVVWRSNRYFSNHSGKHCLNLLIRNFSFTEAAFFL